MTLYKGAILVIENQPVGLQRRFEVVMLSPPELNPDGLTEQMVLLVVKE